MKDNPSNFIVSEIFRQQMTEEVSYILSLMIVEVTFSICSYLSLAKATAPGHLLERMIARPYCGSNSDDTLGVQAGISFTAEKDNNKTFIKTYSLEQNKKYIKKETPLPQSQ